MPGRVDVAGAIITLTLAHGAAAQLTQQGGKLSCPGNAGAASVAISADGNTAVVGGPADSSGAGAAWVFTRAAGVWSRQDGKLTGTGATWPAEQGISVAISADGLTAIVGGPFDRPNGAAWVYARSGGLWSQQGGKLSAGGVLETATIGQSVAISGDGNVAIVGGPNDNNQGSGAYVGAAWVFVRSGGVWSQSGGKLVGTGYTEPVGQGYSVAISSDGATAIIGSRGDGAWVFANRAGVWSQQGPKLVGSGAVNPGYQGISVAISGNGDTVIIGGPADDSDVGAAWVFTRGGGVWSQLGSKLVGTGAVGLARQGSSVAISADGRTVMVGGPGDDSDAGATWVFTRSEVGFSQQGSKLVGTGTVGSAQQGSSVAISADGTTAIVGGPTAYPGGAGWVFAVGGCVAPSVTTQPQSQSVQAGQTATLTVAATGSALLTYQWYVGASGDTSQPVGTNAASLTTPPLLDAASYWVRVSNACGHADSGTAIVSVNVNVTYSSFVWVPVASHANGLNQSRWRSDLGVLNPGGATANARISFFGSDGAVRTTMRVLPGAQSLLTDVVGQLGASGSGSLEVASDQPLGVTARSYNQVSATASCYPDGTQGQDYPVVAADDGLRAGQSAYLAGLIENASYHSNIGVVNVGSGVPTVLVELYDGAGTRLAEYTVANVNAYQWLQEVQPFKVKARQTGMDRGYAKVTVQSGAEVLAFASVIDNTTNDPTTVVMQHPMPPTAAWVPVASHADGLNGSVWRSDLGLLNQGTATANIQIRFHGDGRVVTGDTYVPSGAQSVLTDVVGQLGGSGSGALELHFDQPLVVTARTYNEVSRSARCYPGGTQGQDYPALTAGAGLGAGQSAYLAGLVENARYRSNIGLVNAGADAAVVLVELLDGTGTRLADYTVNLAAGQWLQETQPYLNKAGQKAMDRGYARINVQGGTGVFAFASVVDNITNDPTTVAMLR